MKNNFAASTPNPSLTLMEPFCAAMEFAVQQFTTPSRAGPGDGHPVVILPGLGADRLGQQASPWRHYVATL